MIVEPVPTVSHLQSGDDNAAPHATTWQVASAPLAFPESDTAYARHHAHTVRAIQ